jgi:isopentenyldiphosphate isomerase
VIEEYLEEWDWDSGKPTGRKVLRTLAHRYGIPHEGVHLWIISVWDGKPFILLQRRAASKALFPGFLDITVGGHVPFGMSEGKIEKEAVEELGLSLEGLDPVDLGYFRYEERTPDADLYHREFQHVWLLRDDRPLDRYRFNDGEVDMLAAVPLGGFRGILSGAASCEGYLFDGSKVFVSDIARDAFHPLFFTGPMAPCIESVLTGADRLLDR